jgi:signal transduction histidine kinase
MPTLTDADLERTDPRFLEALASLNHIGATINRLTPQGAVSVEKTLQLIVQSAIKVVPGAAAIIYTYNASERAFDPASRFSAGEPLGARRGDVPRADGIGMRAINQQRRVISYEEPDLEAHPTKLVAGARAMACFPLIVAHQPVGALYVYLFEARRFNPFELLMLDNLVNQAAMAIHQARRLVDVQRDLERSEDALNRLWRAGMLISSRMGLNETLSSILQMALEVTGAHHGIFRLVDEDGQHLVTHAIAGASGRPQMGALRIDTDSIMGWVAVHRQAICIHDLAAAPWVRLYRPLDADLQMRSEIAVPLIGSSGRLEGVLNLESPVIGAFNDQDRIVLQSLATQAVIAIQEARLLDALLEVARLLLIEPCQAVLNHLVALAADLLNASACAIWTLEDEVLVLRATTEHLQRGDRLPLHRSLTGQAVLDRAPVISEAVHRDPRFYRRDLAEEQNWSRALIVPLLSRENGEAIGAFSVYSGRGDPVRFTESEWDKKVLTCLAYYAVLALHNDQRQHALRVAQERHAVAETFAAVGDVAANVLHHLNNKVGTIPVRVQGIQDKCRPSLAADGYLDANLAEIERSAREAMAAVRDSLAYLRPIHPAPVAVAASLDAALADLALPDSVEIRREHLVDLPPVVASARSLVFVFTNLLENAVEAMAGEGLILVKGRVSGSWVEIAVQDNGPGIARDLHERIFEFNVSGSNSRRHSGFGLWWVKTLMMRFGGSIRVESDGRSGSCFRLRLPKAEGGDGP